MFAIPTWAIQLIIIVLQKTGLVGWAGALSLKTIAAVQDKLSGLKSYHDAQKDFPQRPNDPFPTGGNP